MSSTPRHTPTPCAPPPIRSAGSAPAPTGAPPHRSGLGAAGRRRPDGGSTVARAVGLSVLMIASLAALCSAVALLYLGRWEDALRFVVVAAAVQVPRFGDVPAVFASAFAAFGVFATWAAVERWYRSVDNLDLLVHLLTPASLAAVLYFALASHSLVAGLRDTGRGSTRAVVLAVTLVGTAVAVVWEFYEWVMNEMSPKYMLVGYDDTLGDLLAGMVGSMLAGVLIVWWLRRQPASSPWRGGRTNE